jgi:hypothetical protein
MSDKFLNAIRQQASLANSNRIFVTTGIITAYDPTNYLVQVQTDAATEDYPACQTGWIPLGSMWIGNSWGMFAPPNLGDVCSVYYQDGDSQVPFASVRFFGNTALPLAVQSGEFWLVHKSGSFFKLTNDGKLTLSGNAEIDITAPIINITSPEINVVASTHFHVDSPDIQLGDLLGDLQNLINAKFEDTFNNHTHGGGPVPDSPMPSDNITTNVEAT